MLRLIIVIGLLFGVSAGVSSANPADIDAADPADIRAAASIARFEASFGDRLDAQVEEIAAAIVSDAVATSFEPSSLQPRQPGTHPASLQPGTSPVASEVGRFAGEGSAESAVTAGSGRMRCRIANDRMLECRVVAGAVIDSGRLSNASVPAAPTGN